MCVPPCDAGVKPIPPKPASRPECISTRPDEGAAEEHLEDGGDGAIAATR